MPSGKTHDLITAALAIPSFAVGYMVTSDLFSAATLFAAFLLGGIMFGPDLDTVSRQYSRWYLLKPVWYPYRQFFRHRSRFSHGLIFGALFRVIYFLGAITLLAYLAVLGWSFYMGTASPQLEGFALPWRTIGDFTRSHLGQNFPLFVFVGLWLGAASHTFTDMAGSFVKTGRISKFL